ncbi:MAG: hypothetical protein H6728_02500 [Myxococcales bacterium]|nr:hypothetical protein [Myxococcales bacterium]
MCKRQLTPPPDLRLHAPRLSRRSPAPLRSQWGLGTVEIVLLVLIIAILLGIAIPIGQHYSRLSKGSEAVLGLGRVFNGARDFYGRSLLTKQGKELKKRFFPSTTDSKQKEGDFAVMPAGIPCSMGGPQYVPNPSIWSAPEEPWKKLRFSVDGPHYFRYLYTSELSCTNSALVKGQACFHVQAQADLDCDGKRSVYSLHGGFDQISGDVLRGKLLVFQAGE